MGKKQQKTHGKSPFLDSCWFNQLRDIGDFTIQMVTMTSATRMGTEAANVDVTNNNREQGQTAIWADVLAHPHFVQLVSMLHSD